MLPQTTQAVKIFEKSFQGVPMKGNRVNPVISDKSEGQCMASYLYDQSNKVGRWQDNFLRMQRVEWDDQNEKQSPYVDKASLDRKQEIGELMAQITSDKKTHRRHTLLTRRNTVTTVSETRKKPAL